MLNDTGKARIEKQYNNYLCKHNIKKTFSWKMFHAFWRHFITATYILQFLHLNHLMLYIPGNGNDDNHRVNYLFLQLSQVFHHGFYFKLLAIIEQLSESYVKS